jgi:hypothetical protein
VEAEGSRLRGSTTTWVPGVPQLRRSEERGAGIAVAEAGIAVAAIDGLAMVASRSTHAACRRFAWRLEPSTWVLCTRWRGRVSSAAALGLQKTKDRRTVVNHWQMLRNASGRIASWGSQYPIRSRHAASFRGRNFRMPDDETAEFRCVRIFMQKHRSKARVLHS